MKILYALWGIALGIVLGSFLGLHAIVALTQPSPRDEMMNLTSPTLKVTTEPYKLYEDFTEDNVGALQPTQNPQRAGLND